MITIKLEASVLNNPEVCEAFISLIQHLAPQVDQNGLQNSTLITFEGPLGSKVSLKTSTQKILETAQQQVNEQFNDFTQPKSSERKSKDSSKQPQKIKKFLKQSELEKWLSNLHPHKALFVTTLKTQGTVTFSQAYELLDVPLEQRNIKRLNGILGTIARWSSLTKESMIVPWESKKGAYHWREDLILDDSTS